MDIEIEIYKYECQQGFVYAKNGYHYENQPANKR